MKQTWCIIIELTDDCNPTPLVREEINSVIRGMFGRLDAGLKPKVLSVEVTKAVDAT